MIYLLTIIFFASAWANGFYEEPEIDMSGIDNIRSYEMRNGKPAIFTNCTRECRAGAPKRICYYRFTVELYHVMGPACGNCSQGVIEDCFKPQCVTADGVARGCLTINRVVESPAIIVCKGDRVVVDMEAMAQGFQECIHWHGLFQEGSQYYDGVPMLTQCAVQFPDSFRYQFCVNQCGTYFYHSHVGFNKPDGIHGPIMIGCPKSEEPNGHLYDCDLPEHIISITGWTHRPATLNMHPGTSTSLSGIPDNLLINGKGQYTDPDSGNTTLTPLARFKMTRGKKYRWRLINSSSFVCQIQLFIEDHNMTIIATDGEPCEPRVVTTITSVPAQRIDFILHACGTRSSYWIYAKAIGPCDGFPNKIYQNAILYYDDCDKNCYPETPRPTSNNTLSEGVVLAPINNNCTSPSGCVYLMDLPYCGPVNKHLLKEKADIVRYYKVDFGSVTHIFSEGTFLPFRTLGGDSVEMGRINNISYVDPPVTPISQHLSENYICNRTHLSHTCKKSEMCVCTHIEYLPLNKVVEFVFYNPDNPQSTLNHPMHHHGVSYQVRGMGTFPANFKVNEHNVRKLHESGKLCSKRDKYPLMDTVPLFAHGYLVYRIYTSNPGYWLIHCHIDMHMAAGMKFVVNVGTKEDLPPVPKDFPKCGRYLPPIELCPY